MTKTGASVLSKINRTSLPALVIAVVGLGFVWGANVRASWSSLGRDQGIFQYIAWAISKNEVAYRDVRDVNGPVVTMVHLFFLKLGGADEHRFRSLDLFFTGLSFVIAGACIPAIVSSNSTTDRATRIVWAIAAWVTLSAQYVIYGFWDTAQRESFLDWFVIVSIALQAMTRPQAVQLRSRATLLLALSGALSFVPWLGKPTFVFFTLAQLATILIESEVNVRTRLKRLAIFLGGGTLGALIPFAFIAKEGDLASWAHITFVDVPTMYRFIWPRPPEAILSLPGYKSTAIVAAVTTLGVLAFIVRRWLPRRAIPIALMPTLGLVSVLVQAKGFPYHFHPVTLGIAFAWLVALGVVWRLANGSLLRRAAVIVLALLIGGRAALFGYSAPYPAAPAPELRDKTSLESEERLQWFNRVDYFPRAMRDAAEYVAARTKPDDRVQTYGMDAYLLFLAGRRSATPYIYAYDLNPSAALAGAYDPGGIHPSEADRSLIRGMAEAHNRDLLERLQRSPPAAFVFIDRSPLMSYVDSVFDFSTYCGAAAELVRANYEETANFEGIRVWMPRETSQSPK